MGSFFLHALLFYGHDHFNGRARRPIASPAAIIQVQLLPTITVDPLAPEVSPAAIIASEQQRTIEATATAATTAVTEASKQQSQPGVSVLPWVAQSPKVKKFLDIVYPPDTANITATLEIEVSLDKNGKATAVKVLRESPTSMFTEWAWELGMTGQYSPKITADGPVESTLTIRLDITPGMPIEVR